MTNKVLDAGLGSLKNSFYNCSNVSGWLGKHRVIIGYSAATALVVAAVVADVFSAGIPALAIGSYILAGAAIVSMGLTLKSTKGHIHREGEKLQSNDMPVIKERDDHVVCVGDVHGNPEGLQEILLQAGVIKNELKWFTKKINWIAKSGTVFVQMGDVIDRGPDSTKAWDLLRSLQDQAQSMGSKVVRLLGNHELEVLRGDFSNSYYFDDRDKQQPVINDVRHSLLRKIRNDVVTGKVQAAYFDGTYVYVHGRLCQSILDIIEREIREKRGTDYLVTVHDIVDHLNQQLVAAIDSNNFNHQVFQVGASRSDNLGVGGPYWECFDTDLPKEVIKISQIVAHVPPMRSGDPLIRAENNMVCVDVGICERYRGNKGYIKIESDEITAWEQERASRIWTARQISIAQSARAEQVA